MRMNKCIELNYALSIEEYSFKNALTYGIFKGHCEKAFYETSSTFGRRFVHFLIAVVELVPITAIFELVIVKGFDALARKNNCLKKGTSDSDAPSQSASANVRGKPLFETIPNASEAANIKYIITSLATSSVPSILWNRSSLSTAYSELSRIHPLRFLIYVHDDKELNAQMCLMKKRQPISIFGKTMSIWIAFTMGMSYSLTKYLNEPEKLDNDYAKFAQHLNVGQPRMYANKPIPKNLSLPLEEQQLFDKIESASRYIVPYETKF